MRKPEAAGKGVTRGRLIAITHARKVYGYSPPSAVARRRSAGVSCVDARAGTDHSVIGRSER